MDGIQKSDIRVHSASDFSIWLSMSARYNQAYMPGKASEIAEYIEEFFAGYKQILNLPSYLYFRIAPIKARYRNGSYAPRSRTVSIDPRIEQLVGHDKSISNPKTYYQEVIAHELVHAEQFNEGRLKWEGGYLWKGVPTNKMGTTYSAYRQLPWEQEAFNRQHDVMRGAYLKVRGNDMAEFGERVRNAFLNLKVEIRDQAA